MHLRTSLVVSLWSFTPCLASDQSPLSSAASRGYHAKVGVLRHVNPLVGTSGGHPNDNGGMIPSVAPPFGMTRWTPQTRENFISQVPYSDHDSRIHGFQATHQPAIWMGEQGQVVMMPGLSDDDTLPQTSFRHRGLSFRKSDETSTPYVYEVLLDADSGGDYGWDLTEEAAFNQFEGQCPPCPGGEAPIPQDVLEGIHGKQQDLREREQLVSIPETYAMTMSSNKSGSNGEKYDSDAEYDRAIRVALTASAHVGHARFDFEHNAATSGGESRLPYITIEVSRLNWTGHVDIDVERREVSGSNSQRQDYALGPDRAEGFSGYFVSRFSEPFASYGVTKNGHIQKGTEHVEGKFVGAYVGFGKSVQRLEVRTGVSFISVEQARKNLDIESPDTTKFETTLEDTKSAWLEKLGRISISGVAESSPDHDQRTIFYTGLFHALQYPNDFSEPTTTAHGGKRRFYSGYTDSVHEDEDSYYQSWSIWDTYRAEQSLLTLLAPERVDSMMRSLLRIFDWTGWLPMWANVIETNIMIASNADALLANALERGFKGFDLQKAWAAVHKDAYEPPERDTEVLYYDREPYTSYEARAGLTSYIEHGWVDNDRWAESGSRTLDYAFDDYAAAVVATHAGDHDTAEKLFARSKNYANIWNATTEFMQPRNQNGSWADETLGWCEGDMWVYTFDVMHDVGGLADLFRDGKKGLKAKLDQHFAEGHNLHSNEPSHHVPYMYSQLGYPASAVDIIQSIARTDYNATAAGLSGNEDLGQMSAWYVFSALGFYPVNPATDEYVVGAPFFDEVAIELPSLAAAEHTLVISAPGAARGKKYVKSLKVDGKQIERPLLKHGDIVSAKRIDFEMSDVPTSWGKQGTL